MNNEELDKHARNVYAMHRAWVENKGDLNEERWVPIELVRGIVARDNRMFEKMQTFRDNLYKTRSIGHVNIDYIIRKIDEEFSEYLKREEGKTK
jgi:hypothetical protein